MAEVKQIILSVYKFFKQDSVNPTISRRRPFHRLIAATGLSKHQLRYYLSSTRCTKQRKKRTYFKKKLDNFDKEVVSREISSSIKEDKLVTVSRVQTLVSEELGKDIGRETARTTLHECGFTYNNPVKDGLDLKRNVPEVRAWRNQYIRDIMDAREKERKIIYLDESWINSNHKALKQWLTPEGDARPTKSGKGPRWILLEAGCADGWIGQGLCFRGQHSTEDYHGEMNSSVFEQWYEDFLRQLETPSTIVMDNASYHGRVVNRVPTVSALKPAIQDYLQQHNIEYNSSLKKKDLLQLINQNLHKIDTYKVIDRMTWEHGHQLLRLPPYHSALLNPIEQMWGIVKNYVARENIKQTMTTVKDLYEAGKKKYECSWRLVEERVIRTEKELAEHGRLNEVQMACIIPVSDDEEVEDPDENESNNNSSNNSSIIIDIEE